MNTTPTREGLPVVGSSRRTFVLRAAVAVAAQVTLGLLLRRWWKPASSQKFTPPAAPLLPGLAAFTPLVGETFTVSGVDGLSTQALTLTNADAFKAHQCGVAEKFSLRFTAPEKDGIETGIYVLSHSSIGSVELFLSRIGSAARFDQAQKLEAVILFDHPAA